ncbi:MAG: GNAT family N-acetyltransferase [Simplicispira suum]|uniref:GNAT family N-acetyltransferase n=1 Tax=Simplicispira suum TaxID=2109915 RepID=UPI001C6CADA6|nr:GNAT family N-acetyltransferase [Simplicispira suum]MBW7832197.1 GNAT family N-acetyltransferase [Simplicispira suum]
MSDKIAYSVNRSSAAEIAAHLLRADAAFEPALSSRVDIRAYAQKLHDRAVRFEAWLGEELVGLVASYCNQPDGGKAFVTSVSVWPECQGQGNAAWLMRQCIEHVRGLGFGQMELEVDQRSLPAVALYQKLGFNTLRSRGSTLTMGKTIGR